MADKQIITAGSLADLGGGEITLRIEIDDETAISIPARPLSWSEYLKIGYEVDEPKPPVTGANSRGKIYDYADQGYLKEVQDAREERALRRVAAALRIDIPGKTLADKAAALRETLDFRVANALLMWMQTFGKAMEERVAERAETFRRD